MSPTIYYILCVLLSLMVLGGISMMSRVKTAVMGNTLSAVAMLGGIILTLVYNEILPAWSVYIFLIIGAGIGWTMAQRVKMIQMPQMVALLNGVGGAASALVGILSLAAIGINPNNNTAADYPIFSQATGMLALTVGMITLVGSLIAAGKLHKLLPQRPVIWPNHSMFTSLLLILTVGFVVLGSVSIEGFPLFWAIIGGLFFSSLFGLFFSIRVGGADMPITISLLNSLSGVAGAIAGMAVGDILLVAVGGIVGASGLLLTQIMCRAMNRKLMSILMASGAKATPAATTPTTASKQEKGEVAAPTPIKAEKTAGSVLRDAKRVIIVPGYGMALAQAQHQVRQLADKLTANGTEVRYAIHPVAGRMPGHMNVLLCEADVPYDQLFEMDAINGDFAQTDAVVVIGANDVMNPAARNAEGTPIYGMPVLNVDDAPEVIICNFDLKPGYAGVDNPLYTRATGVFLKLGDAKESLAEIMKEMDATSDTAATAAPARAEKTAGSVLRDAKRVIIVPGYGMALAQAQHQVRQLADKLTANGTEVRYAIHPVAGRMPGHMNVLLCEADVPYDQLFEMDAINGDFAQTDAVVVIGANDVMNPAARNAEGTPIYGMPVLNVDDAPEVIICNFDLKPGYAGVDNPLYTRATGVFLKLGDAKESLAEIMKEMDATSDTAATAAPARAEKTAGSVLRDAKRVIIVPGYGMALAQAQHQVRQLADKLTANGTEVRYAIHPVAGRMPGHMNVLLCEADVPYDQLFEMDAINGDFAQTDAVVVIGANDVMNPAARNAEGTPIYGMPVLNVDDAPEVIICNFDLKPGYAGVDNPLYTRATGVFLKLGDAKESLAEIMKEMDIA